MHLSKLRESAVSHGPLIQPRQLARWRRLPTARASTNQPQTDASAITSSNLGQLSRFLYDDDSETGQEQTQRTLEELGQWQSRVPPESLAGRGLYADPAVIGSSGFLLALLLLLSVQRIAGWDQWIETAARYFSPEQRRQREAVRMRKVCASFPCCFRRLLPFTCIGNCTAEAGPNMAV
jgi:hypothetical protein